MCPAHAREQIAGQLKRLGTDCLDLWVLRGFKEDETSVEDTMTAVKVRDSACCPPLTAQMSAAYRTAGCVE